MLKALRDFSLAGADLTAGEEIPHRLTRFLPAQRLKILKEQGYIEDASDAEAIAKLTERVEKLERKLNAQPKRTRQAA